MNPLLRGMLAALLLTALAGFLGTLFIAAFTGGL